MKIAKLLASMHVNARPMNDIPDRVVLAEHRLRAAAGRLAAKVALALGTDSATNEEKKR